MVRGKAEWRRRLRRRSRGAVRSRRVRRASSRSAPLWGRSLTERGKTGSGAGQVARSAPAVVVEDVVVVVVATTRGRSDSRALERGDGAVADQREAEQRSSRAQPTDPQWTTSTSTSPMSS